LSALSLYYANVSKTKYNYTVSKIEKAVVTKEGRLCVYFEEDLTNSTQRRLSLVVPLAQFQTNAQNVYLPQNITCARLDVLAKRLRANWTLLEKSERDLNIIPIGTFSNPSGRYNELYFTNCTPLLNAPQTIYLTRKSPIQFVYVDASIKRPFTIVELSPTVTTKKKSAYYLLLPLTVPADLVLWPFQLMLLPFCRQ
jgi:hypothetical protein